MNKYEFKATNLIAEAFEKCGVKFDVVSHHGSEQLLAGFSVDCGPNVIMRFISRDNDNDIAARIFGLISNTPKLYVFDEITANLDRDATNYVLSNIEAHARKIGAGIVYISHDQKVVERCENIITLKNSLREDSEEREVA